MKTTTASGSLISATMRPEDLIPALLREARALSNQPEERTQLAEIKTRMRELTNYYTTEDADLDLEQLFDLLNEAAPAGYYFGSHPGDGSDYGFWQHEDAYDLDDGEEDENPDDPRATTTDPTEGD